MELAPRSLEDLGDVFLLPGLINAHAHLEFGFLKGQIPAAATFRDWLAAMAGRLRDTSQELLRQSIQSGIHELASHGCAFVADICASDHSPRVAPHSHPGMGFRFYFEMIDFRPESAAQTVARAVERAEEVAAPNAQAGISPHAPYTTTAALLADTARVARARNLPLSIHCAETPEERRLFLKGDGPLREFLEERQLLPPEWQSPGCTPVQWLDRAGILPPRSSHTRPIRTTLVHLNACDEDDLRLLAHRHIGAVVCPGTHRYFGRREFPLQALLATGIPVALGTDSLASNQRLSVWEEARQAARMVPNLNIRTVLSLITSESARVLGIEHDYGGIARGKRAVFTPVASPASLSSLDSREARDWLLDPETRPGYCIGFSEYPMKEKA